MSDQTVTTPSPVEWTRRAVRNAWNTLRTVYYANSVAWRALKSGALVFFGFFLWSASNILLSYQPSWTFLHYSMAYGFVVLIYGPVHHAVVIPLAVRWRRRGGLRTRIGRKLPNAGLAVFLAVVVLLGTFPSGPMVFDFGSALDEAGADVNPDLLCTKSGEAGEQSVHCHLTESDSIASVTVESGGKTIHTDDSPPFEFTVREDELTAVTDQKQFQVVLRDEDGNMIRRYTRTLGMVSDG
ncbi:hypothetical protein [Halorussus litoreus]|uniref:hypothetical protein n=1 Tax=Halorussus litoreus TaxID=1710536 RepID=UPI000E281FE0|nr:hypothetical protein [Halorussus litoreus]